MRPLALHIGPDGDVMRTSERFLGRNFAKWETTFTCQVNSLLEAVPQRFSVKEVFLEISQIHRKTPVPESLFLINLQASSLSPSTLSKRRLCHRYFPVNFAKFLRTRFFAEHLWWLLLPCLLFVLSIQIITNTRSLRAPYSPNPITDKRGGQGLFFSQPT